jgi:hypothetical protein
MMTFFFLLSLFFSSFFSLYVQYRTAKIITATNPLTMLIGIINYDDNNNIKEEEEEEELEEEEVRNTVHTCILCVSTSTSHAHCIKSIRWLFEGEINRMYKYQKKRKNR